MPEAPRTSYLRRFRPQYLVAREKGWVPLNIKTAHPWEKKLVAASLRIVMDHGIAEHRKEEDSIESIKKIIPIATKLVVAEIKEKVPAHDFESISRLIGSYAKDVLQFAHSGPSPEMRRLAKTIDKKSIQELDLLISESIALGIFAFNNKERQYNHSNNTFEQNLDAQLKHDIFHALGEIRQFISQVRQ